jgi:hypothetical protein
MLTDEFTFYDKFNGALIERDHHLLNELLIHAFKTFAWSKDDQLKVSNLLQELG